MKALKTILVLVFFLLAAACSDSPDGSYRTSVASLSVPGLAPIPWDNTRDQSAWDGSSVDLQLADAWSSCSFVDEGTVIDTSLFKDGYLNAVLGKMYQVLPIGQPSCVVLPSGKSWSSMGTLEQWFYLRSSAGCNRDPSTGLEKAAVMPKHEIEQRIVLTFQMSFFWRRPYPYAQRDLRLPAVNHCIAMRLRQAAPGAMGGEALLLSASEQRQLIAEQKNRSQLAALGYAQLLSVFAAREESALPLTLDYDQRIPLLQWWSRQPENSEVLQRMLEDFAAAVQLHIVTTRELAELLARSASARLPRGGSARNRAEEEWGPGSFRARTMASLYGGDPLVEEPEGSPTPWAHPFGKKYPGWTDVGNGYYHQHPWPDRLRSPFVTTELGGPKPLFFFGLAREADALLLKLEGDELTTCGLVSKDTSVRQMVRAVEADLRTRTCFECLVTGPGPEPGTEVCEDCKTFTADDVADVELDHVEDLVIWQRHRISLDDAKKTVALLADFVEPVCSSGGGQSDIRPGTRSVTGELSLEYPFGVGTSPWLRISKGAVFDNPDWMERITPYTALAPWRMPTWSSVFPRVGASYQGFAPLGTGSVPSPPEEAKRVMGSLSAMAAIRDAIVSTDRYLASVPHPNLGNRLAMADKMVPLIGAAIGEGSVSVRPIVEASGTQLVVGTSVDGDPVWEVSIIVPANDPFWDLGRYNYHIGVVKDDRLAQRLAVEPEAVLFGRTQQDLNDDASWFGFVANSPWPETNPALRRWTAHVSLPENGLASWTFIVRKIQTPQLVGLVAGSMRIWNTEPAHGQYLAGGGQLGSFAQRSMGTRSDEPSMAAYDGFGLPTTWVPPTDPTLFGSDGGSAVSHYLERARIAADEATQAVSGAMEAVLAEQSDEASAATAYARSQQLAESERRAMCGDELPTCTVEREQWIPFVYPEVDCSGELTAEQVLDCHQQRMFGLLTSGVHLATVVKNRIWSPSVPTFDEFRGGSFQTVLIDQWRAARQLLNTAEDLRLAVVRAKASLAVVDAQIGAYGEMIELNCSPQAMANAVQAGASESQSTSTGVSTGCSVPSGCGASVSMSHTRGTSYSEGPLIAQRLKCNELKSQWGSKFAEAVAVQEAAMSDVASYSTRIVESGTALQLNLAQLDQLRLRAELALENARMEADLVSVAQTTGFGLYRSYHSYDMWRARALLESARRYAVAARRSVEGRYVVDLSSLHEAEPFVAAPSTWADEVYSYDLSLPAAVGLSVGAGGDNSGIYPNSVKDYVGNVQRFVEGFAIERPTTSSLEDREVFALPGLEWTSCDYFDDSCTGGSPVDAASNAWSFFCPNTNSWAPLPASGDGAGACGDVRPTQARILFSLDPWGRVGMDIAHEPFAQRYNARWTRLAVNLVGTGIKDCANAADPATCYSQPFIRYNLSHVGPAWVTDYEGRWKALGFNRGRMDGAKALATESWLDPISDGWSDMQIDAVMRGEFRDRPLGGTYELVLEVPPEFNLSRLEMVQVMMGNAYWVQQQ